MKETIVTVTMPQKVASIQPQEWWGDAIRATISSFKWKPIVAGDKFALVSDVGTFILDTKSFASGMMCDINMWQKDYKPEFQTIVNAINKQATIHEREEDVSVL